MRRTSSPHSFGRGGRKGGTGGGGSPLWWISAAVMVALLGSVFVFVVIAGHVPPHATAAAPGDVTAARRPRHS